MKTLSGILLWLIIAFANCLHAQNLVAFHQPLPVRSALIEAMKVQNNGMILIGGEISFYNDKVVNNLIRISPDGTLDETFVYNYDQDWNIRKIEILTSGNIVLLAQKYEPGLEENNCRIIIISNTGTVLHEQTLTRITTLAIQPDNKILSGSWTAPYLARYNSDLTNDANFNSSISFDSYVTAISVTNNKILVGGNFSKVNNSNKKSVAELSFGGSLDNTFDAGEGTTDYIGSFTIQPDGKILLGNTYINSFNNHIGHGTVRLNSDGSVDEEFFPPSLNGMISTSYYTSDGIYAAAFLDKDGSTHDRIFRMKMNGELDPNFTIKDIDEFGSNEMQLALADGNLIVNNTQLAGNIFGLSKLISTGEYVPTFKPEISRYGTIDIGDILDGSMLVAGDFIRIDGKETYGIARLNLDGTVDDSFKFKENRGAVKQVKVLEDNRVLVSTYEHFFKLDITGTPVPEFNWSHFKNLYQVIKFQVLPDGKIMVGDFNEINRLFSDGSEDTDFDTKGICCMVSTLFDFDMQGEKVIYGSVFSKIGDTSANRLARLTPTGNFDNTFDIGTGPLKDKSEGSWDVPNISLIKVLDSNEILVGGFFDSFNGYEVKNRLVKLSADGAVDAAFVNNQLEASSPAPVFYSHVQQIGDKIYIHDDYGIYVINTDGTVDNNFRIPASVNSVTDIISIEGNPNGRTTSDEGYLFAFGSFKLAGAKRASILKMSIGGENSVTGVESARIEKQQKIDLFPQPTNEKLKIRIPVESGIFHAMVFDLSGRLLIKSDFQKKSSLEVNEIDVNSLPHGLYMIKIVSDSGQSYVSKFVKD